MEHTNDLEQKSPTLEVTENAKAYLKTAVTWSGFYAIISFVVLGLYVICGIIMMISGGFLRDSMTGMGISMGITYILVGIAYILVAILYFFPALYLYRFSQRTKKALVNDDEIVLEGAFQNMKSYWKFIGILTIVKIAVVILALLVVLVVALM
jgi:hypothetical protein